MTLSNGQEHYHEMMENVHEDDEEYQASFDVPEDEVEGPPEEIQPQLKQLATAVEWLTGLRDTVARRGVSAFDMQALGDIRTSLEENGVVFDPTPSLEHYPLASYTDERSSLNQDVGLEGIASTIVATVKNWIRKLIEFIKRIYHWYRKTFKGESHFTNLLTPYAKVIRQTWSARQSVARISNAPVHRLIEKDVERETRQFLNNGHFQRTPLQLAALGHEEQIRTITKFEVEIATVIRGLDGLLTTLTDFVEGKKDEVSFDDSPITLAGMMAEEAKMMSSEMPKKDYVEYHGMRDKNLIIFSLQISPAMETVSEYEYIYDAYARYTKMLQSIRSFAVESNIDELSALLNGITNATGHLDYLTRFMYQFNQMKVRSLFEIVKYEKTVFDLYYNTARDKAINKSEEKRLEELMADTNKKIKALLKK